MKPIVWIKPPLLASLAVIMLQGCANTHVRDDWDCPHQPGLGCVSINEADQGRKQHPAAHQRRHPQPSSKTTPLETTPYPIKIVPGQPVRIQPTQGRMWFAPFTDKHDHWHDQSFVYFIETAGRWMTEE
jgi:hypothetical protein